MNCHLYWLIISVLPKIHNSKTHHSATTNLMDIILHQPSRIRFSCFVVNRSDSRKQQDPQTEDGLAGGGHRSLPSPYSLNYFFLYAAFCLLFPLLVAWDNRSPIKFHRPSNCAKSHKSICAVIRRFFGASQYILKNVEKTPGHQPNNRTGICSFVWTQTGRAS